MARYLPEMKKLMDKRLSCTCQLLFSSSIPEDTYRGLRGAVAGCLVELNGNRRVEGTLRGYDQFMNIVLDDAVEGGSGDHEDRAIGMVVVRGNSIIAMDSRERV